MLTSAPLENGAGGDVVANPMDAVAGLHRVIPGLLALPAELTTSAQRSQWKTWSKGLPPMPMAKEAGKPILGTEESGTKRYGRESAELHPISPYRLYGAGKPDLDIAIHTFRTRKNHEEKGWRQEPVQAAYLGLTREARRLAVRYLTSYDNTRRFHAFRGPNYDGTPDQTHGGNGLMVLHRMLLHADDGTALDFIRHFRNIGVDPFPDDQARPRGVARRRSKRGRQFHFLPAFGALWRSARMRHMVQVA